MDFGTVLPRALRACIAWLACGVACVSRPIVVVDETAQVVSAPHAESPRVTEVTMGHTLLSQTRVPQDGYWRVQLPNGRDGYIAAVSVRRMPIEGCDAIAFRRASPAGGSVMLADAAPAVLDVGEVATVARVASVDGLELLLDAKGRPWARVSADDVLRASSAREAATTMLQRPAYVDWLHSLRAYADRGTAGQRALLAGAEAVWRQRQPLRVMMRRTAAPFAVEARQSAAGFEVAVAAVLANQLSRPLQVVIPDFATRSAWLEALQRGRVDAVIGGVSFGHAERAPVDGRNIAVPDVVPTQPYYEAGLHPVSRRKPVVPALPPEGAAVVVGDPLHREALLAVRPDLDVTVAETVEAAWQRVSEGQTSYAVVDSASLVARWRHHQLRVGPQLVRVPFVVMLRKTLVPPTPHWQVGVDRRWASVRQNWLLSEPVVRCKKACRLRPDWLPGEVFVAQCRDTSAYFLGALTAQGGRLVDTPIQRVYAFMQAHLHGLATGATMTAVAPAALETGPWALGPCNDPREVLYATTQSLGSARALAAVAESILESLPVQEPRARSLEVLLQDSGAEVGSEDGCIVEMVRLANLRHVLEQRADRTADMERRVPDGDAGTVRHAKGTDWPSSAPASTDMTVFAQELARTCKGVVSALAERTGSLDEEYWRGDDGFEERMYPDMEVGDGGLGMVSETYSDVDDEIYEARVQKFLTTELPLVPPRPVHSELDGPNENQWKVIRRLLKAHRMPLGFDGMWMADLDQDGADEAFGLGLTSPHTVTVFVVASIDTQASLVPIGFAAVRDPKTREYSPSHIWAATRLTGVELVNGEGKGEGEPALSITGQHTPAFDSARRVKARIVYRSGHYRDDADSETP